MQNTAEHNRANEQKWDSRSLTYDAKIFDYFRYMQKKLLAMVNLRENTTFLDLGCGTGWAVCYAANLLGGRGNFVGVDLSRGMIERAKQNALGKDNISFYLASAEDLPFGEDFFDCIICTNSFHHYLNPLEALGEVCRVLKKEGMVYILDVTADDFFIKWANAMVRKWEKEHVKFYSTGEYKSMFMQAGLHYVQSRLLGGYPLKVHTAKK